MPPPTPHPANAPGDFYVEDGCCITCGVPLEEAPEIFAWAKGPEYTSCVVSKQPQSPDEIDRTLAAMWAGEVQCIRYRGVEADIGRRIVEMGHAELCDRTPPLDAAPVVRSRAAFAMVEEHASADASLIAASFLRHFMHFDPRVLGRRATPVRGNATRARVGVSWFEDTYHSIEFESLADGRWLAIAKPVALTAGRGLSRLVDLWLKSDTRFREIRWYSEDQWKSGGPFRSTVI